MYKTYKVSILVPVYGVENYIERCARSLFEQTYENIEFVFVDDCSPDNSIQELEKIIKNYPNRKGQIKIIHHEKNIGLSGARHTAINNATGDFVIHVDSDDWMDLNTVEKLVNKQIVTNADIVSCDMITEGCKTHTVFSVPQISNPHEMIISYLSSDKSHQLCGRLIKKRLYEQILGPRVGVDNGEDTQTMPQLFYYSNQLANVKECLYHYFMYKDSMTHSKKKINTKFELQLIESSIFVRDFFKGKDTELEKQANYYIAYRIWYSLYKCAWFNKDCFDRVLAFKKNVEDNFFIEISRIQYTKLLMNFYTMSIWKLFNKIIGILKSST